MWGFCDEVMVFVHRLLKRCNSFEIHYCVKMSVCVTWSQITPPASWPRNWLMENCRSKLRGETEFRIDLISLRGQVWALYLPRTVPALQPSHPTFYYLYPPLETVWHRNCYCLNQKCTEMFTIPLCEILDTMGGTSIFTFYTNESSRKNTVLPCNIVVRYLGKWKQVVAVKCIWVFKVKGNFHAFSSVE